MVGGGQRQAGGAVLLLVPGLGRLLDGLLRVPAHTARSWMLIALERHRWLLAGVLAGFATAIGPDAIAIIPACAVAALLELRRCGWRDRDAWRSLIAPRALAGRAVRLRRLLVGLERHPFGLLRRPALRWGERTDALALWNQAKTLFDEIALPHFDYHAINLNSSGDSSAPSFSSSVSC